MSNKRLNINIELHVVGDGRKFLNFWDCRHGNDVICEVKDNKLILNKYQNSDNFEIKESEITIFEFLKLIEDKFN